MGPDKTGRSNPSIDKIPKITELRINDDVKVINYPETLGINIEGWEYILNQINAAALRNSITSWLNNKRHREANGR